MGLSLVWSSRWAAVCSERSVLPVEFENDRPSPRGAGWLDPRWREKPSITNLDETFASCFLLLVRGERALKILQGELHGLKMLKASIAHSSKWEGKKVISSQGWCIILDKPEGGKGRKKYSGLLKSSCSSPCSLKFQPREKTPNPGTWGGKECVGEGVCVLRGWKRERGQGH